MEAFANTARHRPMRSRPGVPALLLTILLLVLAAAPAGADPDPAPVRPLKGSFTNVEVPATPPPGCDGFFIATQVGNAIHLGQFTGTGETCAFNSRVVVESPVPNPGAPPYFVADFTTDVVWTAANGDTLAVEGGGVFAMSLADGTGTVAADVAVTGGTGRFEGATGEASGGGAGGMVAFDGWISYDAGHSS